MLHIRWKNYLGGGLEHGCQSTYKYWERRLKIQLFSSTTFNRSDLAALETLPLSQL